MPMPDSDDELHFLREEVTNLRQAVESDPGNVDLRLLLVSRLLEVDQPQGAWHNCLFILKRHPDNIPALRLAKKSSEAAGAGYRAQEYVERLADLLATPNERIGSSGNRMRLIRGGREDSGKTRRPPERTRKLS